MDPQVVNEDTATPEDQEPTAPHMGEINCYVFKSLGTGGGGRLVSITQPNFEAYTIKPTQKMRGQFKSDQRWVVKERFNDWQRAWRTEKE